jgi:hypothetical protein
MFTGKPCGPSRLPRWQRFWRRSVSENVASPVGFGGANLSAAPELPYATNSEISSLVIRLVSTTVSKQESHLRQCQRWRMCRSFRCSVHSGAISSLSQWTHLIPKLERRGDAIVVMLTTSMFTSPISRRSNRTMTIGVNCRDFDKESRAAAVSCNYPAEH